MLTFAEQNQAGKFDFFLLFRIQLTRWYNDNVIYILADLTKTWYSYYQ